MTIIEPLLQLFDMFIMFAVMSVMVDSFGFDCQEERSAFLHIALDSNISFTESQIFMLNYCSGDKLRKVFISS